MKKNTKGFTLIELLAVIVILAIIALIAVPVILNILTKARQSAAEDTCYSVLNAAELYYAETLLDAPTAAFVDTTFTFGANGAVTIDPAPAAAYNRTLSLKGSKPTAGVVTVTSEGKASITSALTIGEMSCTQTSADAEVVCEKQ